MPVLKNLKLHNCRWGTLKVVRISAPNLHFLSVKIDIDGEGCKVMIFGVCLKEFHYSGLLRNEYCLSESIKLEKAEISTHIISEQKAHRLYNLLTGLSNVEFLRLSSHVVEVKKFSAQEK
jgi:hypothetical protein